jgi:hypothetical protein
MSTDSTSLTTALLEFLERLDRQHISYHLQHTRPDSIMVSIAVPGERWEVEFLEDGQIEVERFVSDGQITGAETLDSLFNIHGSAPKSNPTNN